MAATMNKQDLFARVIKQLVKRFPAPPPPEPRPVLDELVYALGRENATTPLADAAFEKLKSDFYDWNEIRVSTVAEVAAALKGLPDAGSKAKRLIEFLQEFFEGDYTFSMEGMEKKGQKQAAKQLARYQGVTDFAVAWVLQRSLGGHSIPLDDAAIRVLRRLKVIDDDVDDNESLRGTVEHYVSKAGGYEFTEAIAELAMEICTDGMPLCAKCPLNKDCPTGQVMLNKKAEPKAKPKAK
jgi:endonuclease III